MTVTLLAFLVALLIGLAVYTRIETAVAGNTQRQAQARENALLALNIALGQLQQHAGPDQRVTATAGSFVGAPTEEGGAPVSTNAQKIHYTGVWDSDPAATTSPTTPRAWLASGIERGTPLNVTTAIPTAQRVELVGTRTAGTANSVVATLQDITTTSMPGARPGAATTIGRYAWWVGDQGVKAPVAVPDTTANVTYAPFDSDDLRARIRQQIALGAGAATAAGEPIFEPRDAANTPLVRDNKIAALNQVAFLRNEVNAALGLTPVRQNFHTWSPNNFAVLANTKAGGLRQDLSINPSLLGAAFAAWTDYTSYMERPENDPTSQASTFQIQPPYGEDPIRRRHMMTSHLVDGGGSHQIGPVLTYLLLTFNVRTQQNSGPASPLEVRARWMISLWNPYTSALVPEELRLEISGLPEAVTIVNNEPARAGPVGTFSLHDAFGTVLPIQLPWGGERAASWLPGRVHTWRSNENLNKTGSVPDEGFASEFDSRTLSQGGDGVQRALVGVAPVIPNDECYLDVGGGERLQITLHANRPDGRVVLGRFMAPDFDTLFTTSPQRIGDNGYQFSYVFRLAESFDTPAEPGRWLMTDGRDLRRRRLPPEAFVVESRGANPAAYENYQDISRSDRLVDRSAGAESYNEDVPVFELPRGPLPSLGAAQHFRIIGRRPFMIGNSWGVAATLNDIPVGEVFDRFFFSGLTADIVPGTNGVGDVLLPSPALKVLRKADGTRVAADDLRNAPDARSSRHLLQGAAFNLNSTTPAAWAAVLRGVRFPTDASAFAYLDADSASGTAADTRAEVAASGNAQFFRFSQSAQETFKADADYIQSTSGSDQTVINTHLFRRGMRTLSAAQVADLATKITDAIKARHAASGPCRSLEEFIRPSAPDAPSLLEQAIADAGINASIAEFSSQWLTQGDILTALAPVLFPRSDTFLIRTYGEVVNPATNAVEGRAWCEATVQRVPEYFDPADDATVAPAELTSALNAANGRRFKVVSFRWLTRSDI